MLGMGRNIESASAYPNRSSHPKDVSAKVFWVDWNDLNRCVVLYHIACPVHSEATYYRSSS